MTEASVIWGGVVVFVALLIKHHYEAKRSTIEAKYDNELAEIARKVDEIDANATHISVFADRFEDRLNKVERQINDAAVAKSLGRR